MTVRAGIVLIIAQVALLVAFFAFVAEGREDDRIASEARDRGDMIERERDRQNAIEGCLRAQADRAITQGIAKDLGIFAGAAAAKRRSDGDVRVARQYEAVVRRSDDRIVEIAQRLEPRLVCRFAFGLGPYPQASGARGLLSPGGSLPPLPFQRPGARP